MDRIKRILNLEEDPTGGSCPLGDGMVGEVDAVVRDIMTAGRGEELLGLLNPLAQRKEGGDALCFMTAHTLALTGSPAVASRLFLNLCEKMEQREEWPLLTPSLELAIDECGSPELARVAARTWEKTGMEFITVDLLHKAYGLAKGDPRVLWAYGNALVGEGDSSGRIHIANSLPEFARKKDYDRLEEGVLNIAEEISRDELEKLLEVIGYLLKADELDRIVTLFEFTKDAFIEKGLSGEMWPVLRKYLEKSTNNTNLRRIAAEFGPGAYPDVLNANKMFQRAGIASADVEIHEAFSTLDRLLELPAGRYVYHHGWGVGQITDNDGDNLIIRFLEKPGHRMSIKLAAEALTFLPSTDLRVKMYLDREGVLRGVRENPADLLYNVLEHVGGEAKQDEIRKQLLHLEILTTSTWADWWKNAKKGAQKDPRFDFSQTFRKVMRLRSEGDSPIAIPEVSMKTNFRKGLSLLFRFLDQHPAGAGEVGRRYGSVIQEQANSEEILPADRMLGHVMLHQVGAPDEEGISMALDAMVATLEMGTLSAEQQKSLLTIVPESCLATACRLLLTSRIITVRREAWSTLSGLPEMEREHIVSEIFEKAPQGGNGVLHLVRELVGSRPEMAINLLHSLLYLLEEPEKDNHRSEALKIVESNELRAALSTREPTEEEKDFLRNRLVHWKHSELFLFPVLESLKQTALSSVSEDVETRRSVTRPRAEASVLEEFGGRIMMTRQTIDRLQKEVEGLDWDLKTTIPRMIRKARELGDLKENAEYDAARNKQRESTKRLEELFERIRLARAIEEIEFDPDRVGPGVEVKIALESGETRAYWILGEGDGDFGEEVVSYRAPLGLCLLGKKKDDEDVLPDGTKFRIESFTQKLPGNAGRD